MKMTKGTKGMCAFVGCLLFLLASAVYAQEKLRIIQETVHKTSPVVVVSRQIEDKRVDRTYENRHGVMAGRGWIERLNFDLKNVSNKNINYIHLELVIPRTGKMEHSGRIVSIFFGNRVASVATASKDRNGKLELLFPGDVVNVRIGDTERARVGDYLKENEAEDVERVLVDIREVHFDDGTGWQLGIELRQDPQDPKIWRSVLKEQASSSQSRPFGLPRFFLLGSVIFGATSLLYRFRLAAGIFLLRAHHQLHRRVVTFGGLSILFHVGATAPDHMIRLVVSS